MKQPIVNAMTVDVEDWYHILDSPSAPPLDRWEELPSRLERNLSQLLDALKEDGARATFFWLGWLAHRHGALVRRCVNDGHEVASHGYGHVLAYKVGPKAFLEDMVLAKKILEDTIGQEVCGFRAPGFGITESTGWAFDAIRQAGHRYDASIFPAARGHGGIRQAIIGPHAIPTPSGPLLECPMSVVQMMGRRLCLFSGGYLRLAPVALIQWGIRRLHRAGQPAVVLVHPREIDLDQPRLDLPLARRFKCYVNLRSTMKKMRWLCRNYKFQTMTTLINAVFGLGPSAMDHLNRAPAPKEK